MVVLYFKFPYFLNYTKSILLWRIPNVLPKGSCLGALVLKSGFQCLIETFVSIKHLRFYAPLRIPSKRERLPVVKYLELPEPHNLCTKKMWKLKRNHFFKCGICSPGMEVYYGWNSCTPCYSRYVVTEMA